MDKTEIFKTLSKYKKDLEEKGYEVIYIGLYGSQNYNVDDEQSDIDARAIILPSLHDIVFREVTSKKYSYDTGEVDVKDIITYYDVIKKGNFSFIEPMDTEYYIGDKYIKVLFKQIRPNPKSMLGAMYEKRKALTHEYPSKKEEFEKWGCDPKQYHHIVRLFNIIHENFHYQKSVSYLVYNGFNRDYMIDIKRNRYNFPVEEFEELADDFINAAKGLVEKMPAYESVDLENEISAYLEKELKKKVSNTTITSAREVRTFGKGIPKQDLDRFPELHNYRDKDISYIVYESLEVL